MCKAEGAVDKRSKGRTGQHNYSITENKPFVRSKTATLKNIHNYSGYLVTDKGRKYVFSIMINHFTNDLSKITEAM